MTARAAVVPLRPARDLRVRPFTSSDVTAVAELHRRAFADAALSMPDLRAHLGRILCEHPWRDPACPSLVCEDGAGRVIGALGVMPRPMVFRGRAIRAAVSHNFMVDPERRHTLAALYLVQAFLNGPQELSLAESTEQARRLWAGLHGQTAFAYSLRWFRPLRPARGLRALWRRQTGAAGAIADAGAAAIDRLAAWTSTNPYDVAPTTLRDEPLDIDALVAGLHSVTAAWDLRPAYDAPSVAWLLDSLRRRRSSGALQEVAVRDARGRRVGWYLYYLQRSRLAQVVQVAGRREALDQVFAHLLIHARDRGAVAVTGRNDPLLTPICAAARCLFRGEPWMLLHAPDPAIGDAVHRGQAFLTPLEGEGWIGS